MLVPIDTNRVNNPLLFERSGGSRRLVVVATCHDGQGECDEPEATEHELGSPGQKVAVRVTLSRLAPASKVQAVGDGAAGNEVDRASSAVTRIDEHVGGVEGGSSS